MAVSPGSFIGSVETSLEEGDKWLSSKTVGYLQESQALGTSRGAWPAAPNPGLVLK